MLKIDTKIIVLAAYRFREFDRNRFEIECLRQSSNVVIHDLIDVLYPHFTSAYHTFDASDDVKRFTSILDWKASYEKEVLSSCQEVYVINHVPITTIKDLFVNIVVSRSNVKIIQYKNPGIANYLLELDLLPSLVEKLIYVIRRSTFRWLGAELVKRLVQLIGKFVCRNSDFLLFAGDKYETASSSKVLPANSFDYNSFLNFKGGFSENDTIKDSIVFVDTGAPLFDTDSLLMRNTHPLTKERWYPALRAFFDNLESLTSFKVVIAAHPKHQYDKKTKKVFGNRDIIHGRTQEMIRNSKAVIVRNSTAISYAILYNKPIVIVHSNELLKDNNTFYKSIKFWSKELSCPFINIDLPFDSNNINFEKNIDKKLYQKYILNYLTSREDQKTNCQVIKEEILNHETIS